MSVIYRSFGQKTCQSCRIPLPRQTPWKSHCAQCEALGRNREAVAAYLSFLQNATRGRV